MGMTTKILGAAASASALLAMPASAQEQVYYERDGYLYAAPAESTEGAQRVIPARQGGSTVVPATPVIVQSVPQPYNTTTPQVTTSYLPNGARLVEFDRASWLAECRDRLNDYDEDDRGNVLAPLLGAAIGGVIGNRIADGNRLGGTLLGAGGGALAGLAADRLLNRDDGRPAPGQRDECETYLDEYMARAPQNAPTTNFAPGEQYMLVPVTVPVAQKATYRIVPVEDPLESEE